MVGGAEEEVLLLSVDQGRREGRCVGSVARSVTREGGRSGRGEGSIGVKRGREIGVLVELCRCHKIGGGETGGIKCPLVS